MWEDDGNNIKKHYNFFITMGGHDMIRCVKNKLGHKGVAKIWDICKLSFLSAIEFLLSIEYVGFKNIDIILGVGIWCWYSPHD